MSQFTERRAVVVFGYEHDPPQVNLDIAVSAFEVIAMQVLGIKLGPRCFSEFCGLIHPYHQKGKVFGWEILKAT